MDNRLYKVYSNRTSKGPIVHGVCDVAPIVGQSPLDIVIYSPSRAEHSITAPATLVVEGVGIRAFGGHSGDITIRDYIGKSA